MADPSPPPSPEIQERPPRRPLRETERRWRMWRRRATLRVFGFGFRRRCSCCGAWLRRFHPFGSPSRPEARCAVCGALERHRLLALYLRARTDFFDGRPKRVLDVAPQPQVSRILRSPRNVDYLSADLLDPRAMVRMDLTDIQYPDRSFDVIYCSHVLEHVPDDRRAMTELLRVLRPGGWAILQVPIRGDMTFEDPTVTSPEERERLFGQRDHVRWYGRDFADRLREVGFDVAVDDFVRQLREPRRRRYGLDPEEDVHLCRPAR